MIAYIKGMLAETDVDTIVVDVGGIGYEVHVPVSIYGTLPHIGEQVRMYTYLNVREDVMELYGFLRKDERDIFKLLISVSGIGPKGALGILSSLTPDELQFAILAEDAKTIAKAPGVGAKTARKLILELKDKMKRKDVFEKKVAGEAAVSSGGQIDDPYRQMRQDAIEALVALGYSATESMQAVRRVEMRKDMSVEELLKQSLKEMMGQ